MHNNVLVTIALSVLLPSAVPASPQSAAELLEKGIYLEETAGRVEAAAEIYRQILGDATADRAHLAEALLRLGMCHLERGDAAAASEAFERVLADFPEQEPFVARAREHLPAADPGRSLELLPAPWADGEVMRLSLKLASGAPIGAMLMSADAGELEGEEMWRFRTRRKIFSETDNQGISQVFARRDTMAPVSSVVRHSAVGHFEARYDDSVVSIATIGADAKREEKLDGRTFDSEEGNQLLRRLPLEVGYKATIKFLSTVAGGATPVGVEITSTEMITVPAGEFECYRMEFSVPQVSWYSTGPSRVLVKFEASGVVGELAEVYVQEPGRETVYSDEELGASVSLPPDWLTLADQGTGVRFLLDPNAEARAGLEIRRARGDVASAPLRGDVASAPLRGDDCVFQTAATRKIGEARTALRDYALRDGTWNERSLAGWPAISFAGDYRDMGREMVHYWTFIESGEVCASFDLKVPADRFEALRTVFDSIIESYRGPPPPPVTEVSESPAVEAVRSVLADFHLAAWNGDPERFFEHLARDAVFFGPDATDRFDVGQLHQRFSDAIQWMAEPSEQHVVVSENETLAWFDGRLESRQLGELRASGVLRPAGGRWKIVQYAVAFPVPNPLVGELAAKLHAHREDMGRQPVDSVPQSADDPAAAARSMLNDVHAARLEVDGERFLGHFAPLAILLGTDRSERLTMAMNRAFVRLYWARKRGPTVTPIEQRVYLSPDENLAWFEERVEREQIGQVRDTGVLRKIDGRWKFVHYNLVILIPKEMAEKLARRIDAFYAPR